MRACLQTEGMTILQHGEMVRDYFNDLLNHLENGAPLQYEWRLPEWLYEHKDLLISKLMDRKKIELYHIYHDCGKPYCLQIDEEGRRHFPNHATWSYLTWGRYSNDTDIGKLIWMDMDAHKLKADQIPEFAARPQAATLLLTALAEIHANASWAAELNPPASRSNTSTLTRLANGLSRSGFEMRIGFYTHFDLGTVIIIGLICFAIGYVTAKLRQ